jgi:hypothetical protein
VVSALGLYDVAPTSRQWLVIPPRHERMSVRFEDGRTFTTRRVGEGTVERVTFNGEPLQRSFLWHDEVARGGELVFYLGDTAGTWGTGPDDRPGTGLEIGPVLPAPWAEAAGDRFRDTMEVRLASGVGDAEILWTNDPDTNPRDGTPYTTPLQLETTTTVRFVATDGERSSPVVTARFDAIEHDWQVEVASTPNPQYTAGGRDALIDGRRGPDDWRTGAWQGYEDQDFVATLRFGKPTPVARAGASFLQDMRSWIWMPSRLIVEASEDGEAFVEVGRVGHDVPDDVEGVFVRDLEVELDGRPVRALRFRAVNYGTVPHWHPGAGGEAFIFVDELIVRTD